MKQEAEEREGIEKEGNIEKGEKTGKQSEFRWMKGAEKKNNTEIKTYTGIDVNTLEKVDWIEIPAQKDALERLEKKQKTFSKWSFLPKVLSYSVCGGNIVIITETRGSMIDLFVKESAISSSFLCTASKKIMEAAVSMEMARIKGKVSMDTMTMREDGRIYIHNDSVWKEIAGMNISRIQTEEERTREIGIALLSLGAGEVLEGISVFLGSNSGDEGARERILEQIIKLKVPCFKEVIVNLLGPVYTPSLLEETLAMHFFYPEDEQEIEPCRCAADDYLDEEDGEDIYYKEAIFGHPRKKTEEIYDHEAGVTVKASTMDKSKFTFQMHFFKSSKKVSFSFNREEDTVDSVMKEMEEEGLACESEISLIKVYMKTLIIKIDDSEGEKSEIEDNRSTSEIRAGKKETEKNSTVPHTAGRPEIETHSTLSDGSEESVDLSMREFKDSQNINEFALEVAVCAKRGKCVGEEWASLLRKQDIKTVSDLRILIEEDWEMLGLSVFASRAMKNILFGEMYTPYKEKMLKVDENMKEYTNESTVEDLLLETAQKHSRPELASIWLQKVKCQEIQTVGELKLLREEDWEQLGLTVFSYRVIRNAIFRHYKCLHTIGP